MKQIHFRTFLINGCKDMAVFVLAKHLVEILRFTACLQACLSVQGKAAVSLRLPALPVPAPFEAEVTPLSMNPQGWI